MNHKYITWYDDVLNEEECQWLVNKFHENEHLAISHNSAIKKFKDINYMKNQEIFRREINVLAQKFQEYTFRYIEDNNIPEWQFPMYQIKKLQFEDFRHKCYQPDVGVFEDHSDATNARTKERYLVMFIYLEDGEGGETVMLDQDIAVQRKRGRMLIFPPMWTYPHRANTPIGNEKNIIGTYLRFDGH